MLAFMHAFKSAIALARPPGFLRIHQESYNFVDMLAEVYYQVMRIFDVRHQSSKYPYSVVVSSVLCVSSGLSGSSSRISSSASPCLSYFWRQVVVLARDL